MISVRDFSAKVKNGCTLVQGVSFELAQGQVLGVYGPNGSGKSTLLRSLAGVARDREISGSLMVGGSAIQALVDPRERVKKIVYLGSEFQAPFDLTVRELFQMGADTGAKSQGTVSEITEASRLESFLPRQFRTLSDGEKQLTMFARVLIQGPSCFLLDESFSKLDLDKLILVTRLIRQATARGHTFLLASHDLNFLSEVADELLLLKNGKMLAHGQVSAVLTNSMLEALYPEVALQVVKSPETGKAKVLY